MTELVHEFSLPVDAETAWELLTDVSRIAECMPGATLDGVEDDRYRGRVKVKIGAIVAEFRGVARFTDVERDARRFTLVAEGRDTRGQSSADAKVAVMISPATTPAGDQHADVRVTTSLRTAGRVAQFGRGVLQDVSERLLSQFLTSLEQGLVNRPDKSEDGAAGSGRAAAREPDEAIDLMQLAGPAVIRRFAYAAALFVVVMVAGRALWGRRRRTG